MLPEDALRAFGESPARLIDYERELNEQQLAAVTAPPGPSLVIAGAGSGKTRTLTYRVAYLLEQGIPPERILLLTFTNKAAGEMMRRVAELLGQELRALWGGTFHAIGNRILRVHAECLGCQRHFTILDREDARHFIAACAAEAGIDVRGTDFPKPDEMADAFSLAVNTRKALRAVLEDEGGDLAKYASEVAGLQQRYTERKRAANAMDFDDLLALWLKLLEQEPQLCEHYQRRFQFILVDEYQDTNQLQSDLIDLLAARHHNLMVVGDDAQSIYAWRGAHFLNILNFRERYPEARIYKIETNYRSTPDILEVANAAIKANRHQFAKQLTPARKPGVKPVLAVCRDTRQQAEFVAYEVLRLREEGMNLGRIAVLYRSHFHALDLQMELRGRQIPHSITSGVRFFEQSHLKDVAAYLKFITNPRDELAFRRLAQMMPGIGGKGAERLWECFDSAAPGSGPETVAPECAYRLQSCASKVPRKAATAWAQFVATIAQLETQRGSPSDMIRLVLEAGYEDYLREQHAHARSRLEDLEQLALYAQRFETVEDMLTQLALLSSVEAEDERPARADDERLRLSTIHQAKGLEFDAVFVIMLCEGFFPTERSLKTAAGEEEERRLMYVAITRARSELYFTYPLLAGRYRGGGQQYQQASRFLEEIPKALLEEHILPPHP